MKTSKWFAAAVFALASVCAQAQTYPGKAVRFVVPFASGGPPDIIGRLLAQRLGEAWGQPVLVENRPGAGGNTGSAQVAKTAPDGYTALVTTSAIAVNASLWASPGFDLDKDLIGVAHIATSPNIFVAGTASGIGTLREALDKAKSGRFNYGSPGTGTTPNLSAEYLFTVLAKANVTHIPYKAGGPALTAALTGEVDLVCVAVPGAVPLVKAGKLRGLAVTSAKRLPTLPDVPTVEESGYPGFQHYTWVGVFVPRGTPVSVVSRINSDIEKLLAVPEFRERLAALAFDPVGGSQESVARYVKGEIAKWSTIVKETGAKAE